MAKKREGQQQAAYEAGTRNVVPGQGWIEALARGLAREFNGADMGTPVGQKLREELGSVGYEDALRQAYPEDYAMGRAAGSDFVDPLTLLAMRGGNPLAGRAPALTGEILAAPRMTPRMAAPRVGPTIEGRATGPAMEDWAVRRGPYREVPIAPQTSGFERGAVAAKQRNARGFGYGYEPPGYFEEGGQGFRPTIDDYVDVNVVRNPNEYYNQSLQDHLAAQMRAGNRGVMRHEMYGPTGDRPAFGQGGEGKGYFGNLPNPGVNRGPRMERGPAPFGEAPAADGGFAKMPRPGIRYDGRDEMATGNGAPRLRYEPIGRAIVGPSPIGNEAAGGLPAFARGPGGLVPREIQGEFYEAPGIGYAGGGGVGGGPRGPGAGYAGSMDFGVTRDGMAGGGGFPWGKALAAGGAAVAPGVMTGMMDRREEAPMARGELPVMPIGGHGQHRLGDMAVGRPFGRLVPMDQPPVFASPLFGEFANHPLQYQPQEDMPVREIPVERESPRGQRKLWPVEVRGKGGKEAPKAQQAQFEPNLNYYVTKALDNLFGQDRAELGRKNQQDVEEYQRKYGPIYY